MRLKFGVGTFFFTLLIASFPVRAQSQDTLPAGFVSKDADVDGLKLHYTTGGHGPTVVLLHGFAETSRMWTPILPVLSEKFTVIAPDLPGIGDSSIPANGINIKLPRSAFTRWCALWAYKKHVSWDTISGSWWPTHTPPSSRRKWRNLR